MWKVGDKLRHRFNAAAGPGRVSAVEGRSLTVVFPATGASVRFATGSDALEPFQMAQGATARLVATGELVRIEAKEGSSYRLGDGRVVPDEDLWPVRVTSAPAERLARGEVDSLESFANRLDGLHLKSLREAGGLGSFLGGRIRIFPHQLDVAERAVRTDPVRWLLADEVGLGKTVEACLILNRLARGGRAERVLIVAPSTLTVQWLGELYRKFHQVFVLLDAARRGDVERELGKAFNPFEAHARAIIALEDLVGEAALTSLAVRAGHDLVVVDEAHRLERGRGHPGGGAYRAVAPIVRSARHALLLTATPLESDAHGFFRLLQLLRPEAFPEEQDFEARLERAEPLPPCTSATRRADIGGLPPRVPVPIDLGLAPCPAEGSAGVVEPENEWTGGWNALLDLEERVGREPRADRAQAPSAGTSPHRPTEIVPHAENSASRALPAQDPECVPSGPDRAPDDSPDPSPILGSRAVLPESRPATASSRIATSASGAVGNPAAGGASVGAKSRGPDARRRIERYRRALASPAALAALLGREETMAHAEAADAEERDPRTRWLSQQAPIWRRAGEKTLIFVAHIETLESLKRAIERSTGQRVGVFHEGLTPGRADIEVAQFRLPSGPAILVSTECGGEGRNFQFCKRLVLFDLPWNPGVVEQRIGRLDRIDRDRPVEVLYFRPPRGLGLEVVRLYEQLGVLREPVAGLEGSFAGIEAAIEAAAAGDLSHQELAASLSGLLAGARDVRSKIRAAAWHELHREPYRAEMAPGIRARIPADLEETTAEVVLAACEDLGFRVIPQRGVATYAIEFGSAATIDHLPGVPGGSNFLGTFDRLEAVEKENIDFFASGHPLVEGILQELEEGPRGQVALLQVRAREVSGSGVLALFMEGGQPVPLVLDEEGRERPEWAPLLLARPLRSQRVKAAEWTAQPGWAERVRTLLAKAEGRGTPLAVAAFRLQGDATTGVRARPPRA